MGDPQPLTKAGLASFTAAMPASIPAAMTAAIGDMTERLTATMTLNANQGNNMKRNRRSREKEQRKCPHSGNNLRSSRFHVSDYENSKHKRPAPQKSKRHDFCCSRTAAERKKSNPPGTD